MRWGVEGRQQELFANLSHDLRTPLTLMEGYAEVMRELPGENTPENMQVIIDETKRLSTLVNAVLELSKARSSAAGGEPVRFDLTQTVRGIMTRYAKLTEQDGYHILFEPEGEAWVIADEVQAQQVLYNLINNALTYTGKDKRVTIAQRVADGKVRISVSDTGEGIALEDLPYIWSRYYRGGKPHKRATVGSGLGLNIVKGILDRYGLSYGVESKQGEGSTFWFEMPLAPAADETKLKMPGQSNWTFATAFVLSACYHCQTDAKIMESSISPARERLTIRTNDVLASFLRFA